MSVSVFNYMEYQDYLRAWIADLPQGGRGELARIARHLEINTTLLSQIMSKSRDFSMEQALGLGHYLGLNKLELEYFLNLVQLSKASHHLLKKHLLEKLGELRTSSKKLATRIKHEKNLSDSEKAIFYSSWLYSAIHLFTSIHEKGVTAEDVSQRFDLPRSKVTDILRFLCDAHLCVETKGYFTIGTQSTFVPKGSPHLNRHHLNWRIKSMEKVEMLEDEELMYTAQISISKSDFEKIRELAIGFIQKVNEIAKPSAAEEIVNLNLDLFKLGHDI